MQVSAFERYIPFSMTSMNKHTCTLHEKFGQLQPVSKYSVSGNCFCAFLYLIMCLTVVCQDLSMLVQRLAQKSKHCLTIMAS